MPTPTPLADRIHDAARASKVLVMGILNVTPDSFSDGGRFDSPAAALDRARRMIADGAAILDIGGESTRPGAAPVGADAEIERVVPVIDAIRAESDVAISIDTMKAAVMHAAVAAGADMINDVNGLREADALAAAAELDVPVCIMHMQGEPRTMQQRPDYRDVVDDLLAFFRERIETCLAAGIQARHLVIDPGFGFGKTLEHNLTLLREFTRFRSLGLPLLAGISRKSMLGTITGHQQADQRVAASVAAAVLAIERGADIVRVHDVAETVDAVRVVEAMRGSAAAFTPAEPSTT